MSRHRILTESAVELDDDISSEQQSDVLCQPLLVIAPISVLYFLHSFTTHILPTMKSMYTAVACNHFDPDKISNSVELVEDALINDNPTSYRNVFSSLMKESMKNLPFASQVFVSLGISRFENINVVHCSQAFGLALTLQASAVTSSSSIVDTRDEPVANIEPDLKKCKVTEIEENHAFKIVYSGDTRPCSRLAQLGLNASLLIHEATFDDLKQEEAIKKRHSTITEALEVARDMNAHRTILTHFSQRYPNTPPVLADPTLPAPIFASDFMNIAFRDLSWAPNTTAAMTRIFPADADEDEDEVENISKEQNPPLDTVSFVTVASVDQYNGRSSNSKESESQAKSKNKTGSSTIFIPNKTPKASGFLSAFCDCEQDLCNHRINN